MLSLIMLIASLLLGLACSHPAIKPTLHIFGDSLSDIGRLKSLSYGLIPPAAYWNGRFSSGPLWNEYLTLLLDTELDNHAVGVAKARSKHRAMSGMFPLEPPSTHKQIADFARKHPEYSSSKSAELDFAILEIGSNDAQSALVDISDGTQSVYEFAQTLSDMVIEQLEMMQEIEFKNILVLNLPALQFAPIVIKKNRANIAQVLVNVYNRMLNHKAQTWAQTANISLFDVVDLGQFMHVSLEPNITHALQITDTASYCISGGLLALFEDHLNIADILKYVLGVDSSTGCQDPSAFFFFDPIHPTERVQRLFGYYLFQHIEALQKGQASPSISKSTLLDLIHKYKLHLPVPKPAAI